VVTAVVSELIVVTDSTEEAVVLGKRAEVETKVPLLPSSDEDGINAVPLDLKSVPLLPSSDEEGVKADDTPVPVGPTTTELMLNVGKGAP
jgi:hypothetical protein